MEFLLRPEEVRVLGSLIEKKVTSPEYYPLTLNALVNACNQKSNRQPVTSYDEKTVVRALDDLREKRLASMVTGATGRVPKYKENFIETVGLDDPEVAVMCLLILRGPQTVGELKNRSDRLFSFSDLPQVEQSLDGLIARESFRLVTKLPRQPGQKESRYAHLLSGEPVIPESAPMLEPAALAVRKEEERLDGLENEVAALRELVENMKREFEEFRKQFE